MIFRTLRHDYWRFKNHIHHYGIKSVIKAIVIEFYSNLRYYTVGIKNEPEWSDKYE